MTESISQVLFTQEELQAIIQRLAGEIAEAYKDKRLLVIGILKGAFVFLSDLIRVLPIPCEVEFLRVSSYRNETTGGELEVLHDMAGPLDEYDVLVVEDILDSGRTLSAILQLVQAKNPRSLRLCALLDKPARRQVPVEADFVGAKIPDAFVVGYGLDYAQRWRWLPYVGCLELSD